jgi:hypothetical protein
MSSQRISCQIMVASLLTLLPVSALPEQIGSQRTEPQQVSGKLIPPRSMIINKESLDQMTRMPSTLPAMLTASENAAVLEIVTALRIRNTQSATTIWSTLVTGLGQRRVPADINALIQYILRETYLPSNQDLQKFADKVRVLNNQKKQTRDELTRLQQIKLSLSAGKPTQVVRDNTPAQVDNEIKALEEKLATIGDDAQLANIDLQNMLQKQQQTIQMLSNISKILSDIALSVIRKIGG